MDSTPQPAITPTPTYTKSPISLNFILILITFISLLLTGYFIYQNQLLQQRLAAIETKQASIIEPTPSVLVPPTDPTANWKTYTNTKYNFAFKHPPGYSFDESEGLISILSPLSQVNRGGFSVKEDELKIEIWISPSPTSDTLEKFVNEEVKKNTEGYASLLKESETEISGTKAVYQEWSGMGENSVVFFIENGHRFAIAKYPLTTSRQNEYDQILSTFKFLP